MVAPANSLILQHIYASIPVQVLREGFEPDKYGVSLDERILGEVIARRVLNDANLTSGRQTQILLQSDWMKQTLNGLTDPLSATSYNACFFWIPPQWRENRNISAVIRVMDYNTMQFASSDGSIGGYANYGNTVSALADAMVGSRTLAGSGYTPQATLEGNNLIKVYGNYPNTYFGGLTAEVCLEYDTEFNNIDKASLYYLRDLALCATKAWLWNKLVVEIDQGQVSGGMMLGVFKDIVDSYANANDEYAQHLMNFSGAQYMDENNLGEFVRLML